jgi:DNA-binding NarL/FixJ family response regulator
MIRVMLADDNAALRRAIRDLLEMSEGILVVGEVSNGLEAVEIATQLRPDVLIMDGKMPQLPGLEAACQLATAVPDTRVLLISGSELADYLDDLPANVKGYCSKMELFERLAEIIQEIHAGCLYFPTLAPCFRQRNKGTALPE